MTLKELKAGLNKLLQTKYPKTKYKYYSMAVVENYSRPCFFTHFLPVDIQPENYNSCKNTMLFYITIMQEKNDEAEVLDMIDEIRKLFGLTVQIGDRAVKVTDFDWNYTGSNNNIPEISIELQWHDKIEHKDDAPLMEHITTRIEMED